MDNAFDTMRRALREAELTQAAADEQAAAMASLLVGRLRHCGEYALKRLKRELRDFNIHTGTWKD